MTTDRPVVKPPLVAPRYLVAGEIGKVTARHIGEPGAEKGPFIEPALNLMSACSPLPD